MKKTASTILRLIVEETGRHHLGLLPVGAAKPDYVRTAYACDDLKHQLLDAIYSDRGPNGILQIGRGINRAGFTPLWHILFKTAQPHRLLNTWRKIEESMNARFRINCIQGKNGKGVKIQHYTCFGRPTQVTENLLIFGLFLSVFERSGCQGLRCYLMQENGSEVLIYCGGNFLDWQLNHDISTSYCRIEWDNHEADLSASGLESCPTPELSLLAEYQDHNGVIESAVSVIKDDLSRAWKVGDIACILGFSRRSLQRYLWQSKLNFSILLRAVRFQQASLLLSESTRSITDISYSCGFSDSAHFSRDFREGVGISPSAYRHIALAG